MISYFKDPNLQIVTYTITEKGYSVIDENPERASSAMGLTCLLLLERFKAGAYPISMVTTDNFSQNGQHFQNAILSVAKAWQDKGFVDQSFVNYISDESKVSFP